MRPIARPIALAVLMAICAGGVTTPALAQRGRNVFPDEGVNTRDAMLRVHELSQAGNVPEALRVLQKTLDGEGAQLVQTENADLFIPVRSHINGLLLSRPDLLERYRLEQEPAARKLLEENRLAELEHARMLTPSGMEAVLRLAQVELEHARFESARLMLAQLEKHPDRAKGSPGAARAAQLAGMIAAYLPRAAVRDWASRWIAEAGLDASGVRTPEVQIPAQAGTRGTSPLSTQPSPKLDTVPERPLQSVPLDIERLEAERNGTLPDFRARQPQYPWMLPTLNDGVVYVNDGRRISAWDSATLGEVWQVTPSRAGQSTRQPVDDDFGGGGGFFQSGAVPKEDAATVTLSNGIAVGVTGVAEGRQRNGDRRLHAIQAGTGKLLWSIDPSALSDKLAGGSVYGPPLVEADTVVLAIRSTGTMQRNTRHYLVGVNLYTGALRYLRLVGTQQSPMFGRTPGRPDGGVLHEGIYYRADEVGVLYAYEACSGRPVWLRTMPANTYNVMMGGGFNARDAQPPHHMHVPVLDGDALVAVEFPRGRVVRVGLANGELLASRDGSGLGDPQYLVRVGDWIAGVNATRVAFFKGGELTNGPVQMVTPSAREVFAGRVSAVGTGVLVPLENGAAIIDPNNLQAERTARFEGSGNLIVAGEGERTHLIAADPTRLHTFLRWEEAERILTARVSADDTAPQPLLTFVELAARTGRAERVPDLADRALGLLDQQGPDSVRLRGRLFTMLLDMVRTSRTAWSAPNQPPPVGAAQPVKDIALLGQVMERLERSAESGQEQVAMLLEKAWLADKQNNAVAAIEAYQRILTDTGLAAMELDPGARLQGDDARAATSFSNARTEATDRLVALVKRVGPGPYAAFDEEAQRLLLDTDPTDAERLAELARAYPVAAVAPEAWNRASGAYAAAGKAQQARLAAGSGLAAAELGAGIGRQSTGEMMGRLAGSLLARSTGAADIEPAYRLLQRLHKQTPGLAIDWNGTTAAPGAIAATLREKLNARGGMPVIGPNLLRTVQVIEAWEPMEPVVRNAPGVSGDCVVMGDENAKAISMWGVAAEDGKLRQMWTRQYQSKPIVVRITPDTTLLFWPSQAGGAIEAVSTIDGKPQWRTPEFASLFEPTPAGENADDRVNTPLDGPVRTNDLVVTADGSTLVLAQRRGRVGAFDLTTGQSLWKTTLDISRVYELEQAGDAILLGGTAPAARGRGSSASVIALDKRTGKQLSRLGPEQLGDHARWMRAIGDDAIVATATGMLRYTPATGKMAWFSSGLPGGSSFAGWVVGDGIYVLDGDVNLWYVNTKDGTHADKPLDTRGRVVFPVSATVMGSTLAVTSTNGLVVFNDKGELIGADALDGQGSLQTPVVSSSMFLAVENNQREDGGPTGIVSRVFMFAHPTGKLLNTERVRLYANPHATMVIDGKVLLSEGPVTLVLDAPPK